MHIPIRLATALCTLAWTASAQEHDVKTSALPSIKDTQPALELPERTAGSAGELSTTRLAERLDPLRTAIAYGADELDGISAATWRWKARFSPEGVSFVPFLGSEKPRSLPLTFRLESIRAGGLPLATAGAGVTRSAERVAIARGAALEVWHLGLDGVEQTFVLSERSAPGEILVRVAFEGEYEAALDGEGILFTSELGVVRYGRAFAFDAAGLRTEVEQELEGRSIVLRVPPAFVAEAQFPITIDPIITTYSVESSTFDTILPDVAFLHASGRYLYTYVRVFSQTDHDVFSVLASDVGIVDGTLGVIDSSVTSWTRPRVASNAAAMNYLVVAEAGPPGSRGVRGRLVNGSTGTPGGVIEIIPGLASEHLRPDVGGDPNPGAGTRYCVVWERAYSAQDHDIWGRMVDAVSGALSGSLLIENSSSTLDRKPAIASSCGLAADGTPHWTVVWEREATPQDRDVHGAQIAWDGTLLSPAFAIDAGGTDDIDPSVSPIAGAGAGERPYVVATSRLMQGGDRDIFLHGMVGDQRLSTYPMSSHQPMPTWDDLTPVVETDGHMFGVAHTRAIGPSDRDVWVSWIAFAGGQLAQVGSTEVGAGSSKIEDHPALVSRRSGGATSRQFALACDSHDGQISDIRGVIVQSHTNVPFVPVCTGSTACPCGSPGGDRGCPNSSNALGASLSAIGYPRASADSLLLEAGGLPAGSMCLFLQGTTLLNGGNGLPFGDGLRCVGGSIIRLGTRPVGSGNSFYPGAGEPAAAERGQIPAFGGTRYYQAWYRDPASFCTGASFNLTNALKVVWLP